MTRDPLRVLHYEPSGEDHLRVRSFAERVSVSLEFQHVTTAAAFTEALQREPPDVILADLPELAHDDLWPLLTARSTLPGVPFIVVSGSVGEDRAADCLLSGAWDFVHKDRLERLAASLARALKGRLAGTGSRAPWAEAGGEVYAASTKGWRLDRDPLHAQKVE
jgi:DNA-binding NtrC family response regulator